MGPHFYNNRLKHEDGLKQVALFLVSYLGKYPEHIESSNEFKLVIELYNKFDQFERDSLTPVSDLSDTWNLVVADGQLIRMLKSKLRFLKKSNTVQISMKRRTKSVLLNETNRTFIGWVNTSRKV